MKNHMNIPIVPADAQLPQVEFEITLTGRTQYEGQPRGTVAITTDAVSLTDILPVMEDFLKGMGFGFTGHLDIVDEED